jgi:hypothetical protein
MASFLLALGVTAGVVAVVQWNQVRTLRREIASVRADERQTRSGERTIIEELYGCWKANHWATEAYNGMSYARDLEEARADALVEAYLALSEGRFLSADSKVHQANRLLKPAERTISKAEHANSLWVAQEKTCTRNRKDLPIPDLS